MAEHIEAIGLGGEYKKETIPCEVCAGSDFAVLQERGRIARAGDYGSLSIAICRRCGYKMQNPRYEDRFYQDYYRKRYREVAFGETKPSSLYIEQQKTRGANVLDYISEHFDRPGVMLDHGCASGATMLPFREAGWKVFGIDPHEPSVVTGREEFGLDIRVAGGENLPFDDSSFDLVLSLGSLEHVYNLDAAMTECRRVLKGNGCLLIRWRSNVLWGSPYEYYNHNHYRFLSRRTWALALLRYGLDIVDMTDREIEGNTGAEYIIAKLSKVRSLEDVVKAIDNGRCDDAEEIARALGQYKKEFAVRCRQFLDYGETVDRNAARVAAAVDAGRLDYRLLWGDPDVTVPRAFLEAERYLEEFANE